MPGVQLEGWGLAEYDGGDGYREKLLVCGLGTAPHPSIMMLKWQRSHLKGVWVLTGIEQEVGANLLRAPGKNFQGPDYSPTPGLRVRKAPDVTIANFTSYRERMTCLRISSWAGIWDITAAQARSPPCLGTVRRPCRHLSLPTFWFGNSSTESCRDTNNASLRTRIKTSKFCDPSAVFR